jgi:hypothetical protein
MNKILVVLILSLAVLGTAQSNVTLLKWAGPEGSRPGTYEEWIAEHPYMPFSYSLEQVLYGDQRAGNVALICEQTLYNYITAEINQLSTNLVSEGYTVYSYQMTGGTPESLRTLLSTLYSTSNIEGALLIGSLPVAWFEVANDHNQYGYADFPCDLFFMDLDGTWLDTMTTGNGRYDGHTGAIAPEIYVGRLYPHGIGVDTALIKNYFRKNNAYRHDTLLLTQRALVFVDNDWIPWAGQWAQDVSLLYSDTMNYWDPETTRASVYRTKLNTTQAWVSVFAHSWPGGHQFLYNGGASWDYYYASEYVSQDPPTNFYNFFCCSFCRFTEAGNCGGNRAIFNQTSGVGSIGSTKTGSMLEFSYFYTPLGQGKTLGEAFKDWFTHITDYGVTYDELCWHYGMTLLADCYLKPVGHSTSVAEYKYTAPAISPVSLQGNPLLDKLTLNISIDIPSTVEIVLHDCTGRKIADVYAGMMNPGTHVLSTPLRDSKGLTLPSGTYFIKAQIIDKTYLLKCIKL